MNTVWHEEEEVFLEKLHMQAFDLYEHWNMKSVVYKATYIRFNVPNILISGINTVLALLLAKYIKQDIVSAVNAGLSMTTAIIGSINMLLRINERYSLAIIVALKYHRLCIKISKELSIPQSSRTLSGINFLNECHAEFTDIFEKADPMNNSNVIPRLIYKNHLINDSPLSPSSTNGRLSKFIRSIRESTAIRGFKAPSVDILDRNINSNRTSFSGDQVTSTQQRKKMSMDLFSMPSQASYKSNDGRDSLQKEGVSTFGNGAGGGGSGGGGLNVIVEL